MVSGLAKTKDAPASERPRTSLPSVVIATASIGFLLGAFTRPTWQVAVESAQVLSGIVTYPAHNSFHIYHVKLWTIVNQLLAMPLALGFSEKALSVFVSGCIGALSFCAIGVCIYSVSRNVFSAIAAPVALHFSGLTQMLAVNYPMDFIGTPHTYGAVGLAWSLLTISLLALECYGIGGFFLGLAPAVHPSMGIWCWAIVLTVLVWNRSLSAKIIPRMWKPAAAGLATSVASFLVQLSFMRPVLPQIDASTKARFVSVWVDFFDFHRRAVDMTLPGVQMTMAAVVIALYLLPFWETSDGTAAPFVSRLIIVASTLALLGAAVSELPASIFPPTLLTLMPTRLFLLSNLAFVAMLIGLISRYPSVWVRISALALSVAMVVGNRMIGAVIAAGVVFMVWKSVTLTSRTVRLKRFSQFVGVAAAVVVLAFCLKGASDNIRTRELYRMGMVDRSGSAVLNPASSTSGLIAIGTQCCPFTQLRTRRPLLVETQALDQIMYAPESAPDMNAALKAVYGVDLLHPQEILRSAGFNEDLTPVTKPLWEARSPEEWKALATTFGFTAVLTNPSWTLKLSAIARDSEYVLYEIPR